MGARVNWLTPMAGVWLAIGVIPPLVVLYFLKLRRRSQAISTTLLWKRSIEDLRANAPFQKLRKSLLLLLQLLALILLALSIAQPQIQGGTQLGGKIVIMIDNSASMTSTNTTAGSAVGGAPGKDATRLDEAKRRAKEKIEALYGGGLFASSGGETMIVAFSDRAEIISRFTDSKQQLIAAIDRIQPTHGETTITDALKLARAYTSTIVDPTTGEPMTIDDPPTLDLYSDGRIDDLADQVLRGEDMTYQAIGTPEADNVSISSISVERPYDRPSSVEVFATLLNFNQTAVKCDVQLSVDDRVRGIEETRVPAAQINEATKELMPGRANVVFTPFEQPRGAVIEVANLRTDDLAADNVTQIAVAPPKRLNVALVSANHSQSIIKKAMDGMPFIEHLVLLTPDQFETQAEQSGLDAYDAIVIDNYKPKLMPAARYLTFGPTPPVDGLNEFGEGTGQIILSAKDEHPVMRYVSHDAIYISRFMQIQPGNDVQVLMEGSNAPAALTITRGSLQLIHCPFDPLESNWPFQRSFVAFLYNAIEFLGNAGQALTTQSLKPGEAITARLPANAQDITLVTPDNPKGETPPPLDPTQFAWGPIRLTGLHILSWKSPDNGETHNRAFAVNLLSEREGRIDVVPSLKMGQEFVAGQDRDESVYTPLWPWALGVCLALLMFEWWVYHKKAYI